MGRSCTICMHPAYDAIDAALEAGQPLREIAAIYCMSKTALHRHWHAHVFVESSPVPSNTETSTKIRHGSRAKTIAKWVLITGVGLGILVWSSRILGDQTVCRQLTARQLGLVRP